MMSHTEKIKVLMAWASSNGTLSCAVHVRARVCGCMHINKAAFKASLIYSRLHYGIQGPVFLSFYLQLPPSPLRTCGHLFTCTYCFPGCRAARIGPMRGDSVSPAPHPTHITPEHTAVKVKRQFFPSHHEYVLMSFAKVMKHFVYFNFTTTQMEMSHFLIHLYY